MIAGPSEILVVSDGETDPDWLAMDLFSQAEHDEDAQAILVSWDEAHLDTVAEAMARQLPTWSARRSCVRRWPPVGPDPVPRSQRGVGTDQSHRARASRALGGHARDLVARGAACRRHLHGSAYRRGTRGLLCRAEPCPADIRHGAIFVTPGGLRLPEALLLDSLLGEGSVQPGADRLGAGARRVVDGSCAQCRVPHSRLTLGGLALRDRHRV